MPLPIEETIAELTNSDQTLRNARLVGLSNLNSEEIGLWEQAWANIEPKRRRQIIYRLVELAEDNCEFNFDSIFRSCLNDQDAEVRSKAIEGLWESEDASLIGPLVNLLEQDSSEKVQVVAAMALGRFAMLAELEKLRPSYISRVKQALFAVLADEDKPAEVRRRALEAAAPLSLPQVNEAIMEAYQSDDISLKVSAIYAMGRNCNPSWLPLLEDELDSAEAEIRYEAAVACGELGAVVAVPYLAALVNDPDTEVQFAVVAALGKIGGAEAKECLEECLNGSNHAIREAARQALDELDLCEGPLSFPD